VIDPAALAGSDSDLDRIEVAEAVLASLREPA